MSRFFWTEDKVKAEILNVVNALCIDRMPTKVELESVCGDSRITNVISKRGGYKYWANLLNLQMKNSDTKTGWSHEKLAMEILKRKGFLVEKMSTKFAYDLLIDGVVKVDVKGAKPFYNGSSRIHTFNIRKEFQTCDIYLLICIDDNNKLEKTLVVPGHLLQQTTASVTRSHRLNEYQGRYDLIERYLEFFKQAI